MFTLHDDPTGLPVLTPPAENWQQELTLLGSWPRASIAQLCKELKEIFPGEPLELNVSSLENVCLNNVSGAMIKFGGPDKIPEKLTALRKILAQQPNVLTTSDYVSVESPDVPVSHPKAKEAVR
jgi:hypothetical protein